MSQENQQFKVALAARLTEALAREDTSAMTVRQLREFVARIVDEAVPSAMASIAVESPPEPKVTVPPPPIVAAPIGEGADGEAVVSVMQSQTPPQTARAAPETGVLPEPEIIPLAKSEPAPEISPNAGAMVEPATSAALTDDESDVRTIRIPVGAIALIIGVLIIAFLLVRSSLGAAPTGAPRVDAPPVNLNPANNPAAPQQLPANAKNPTISADGTVFQPERTFSGDTTGKVYEIAYGKVTVKDGALTLLVGGVPGNDGVYDYVRLQSTNGKEIKFEAEDAAVTKGDAFTNDDRLEDGHWWLQSYGDFSANKGLVIRKQERVPLLTTTMSVPNGEYDLFIGSFKGDPGNGAFGLGVTVK